MVSGSDVSTQEPKNFVTEISELCINGEDLLYEWAKRQTAKIFTVNTQQPVVLFLAFEERRNGGMDLPPTCL